MLTNFSSCIDLPISKSAAFPCTADRVSFAFPDDINEYLERSPYSLYDVATCSVAILMHRFTLQNKITLLVESEEQDCQVHSVSLKEGTSTRDLMAFFSIKPRSTASYKRAKTEVAVLIGRQSFLSEITAEYSLEYAEMKSTLIDFNFVKGKKKHSVEVSFSRAFIDRAMVEEMTDCLFTLFEDICSLEDVLINKIRLISPIKMMSLKAKRRANDISFFYFPFYHMFDKIVSKKESSLALTDEKGQSLTYLELLKESNQVANYVLKQNPQKKIVAIVGLSSRLTLLAVLGCIRSGIEFVLLPQRCLSQAIHDRQLEYCICDESLVTDVPHRIDQRSPYSLESPVLLKPMVISDPASILAYVYSAKPYSESRCFSLSNRMLFDQFAVLQSLSECSAADVVLSLLESGSVLNFVHVISALLGGAHVLLPRYHLSSELRHIHTLITESSVTHLHATPTQLQCLMRLGKKSIGDSLRHVFSHRGHLSSIVSTQLAQSCNVYNVYSLSELGGAISYYQCSTDSNALKQPISVVGCGFEFLVLDEEKRLLPRGALGYLYLSLKEDYAKHVLKSAVTSSCLDTIEVFGKRQVLLKTGDTARSVDAKSLILSHDSTIVRNAANQFPVDQMMVAHKLLELLSANKVCLIEYTDKFSVNRIIAFIVPLNLDPNYYLFNAVDVIKSFFPKAWYPKTMVLVKDLVYKSCGTVDDKAMLESFVANKYPCYVQFNS